MSKIEKERFEDRVKSLWMDIDPNDEFSNIKTLSDLNNVLEKESKKDEQNETTTN